MGIFDRIINFNQYQKVGHDIFEVQEKMDKLVKSVNHLLPEPKYYSFSKISLFRLEQCHPDIQKIMHEAIKYIDFSIMEGSRLKAEQDEYFASGTSKVRWPYSYHNTLQKHIKSNYLPKIYEPERSMSLAIDVVPYPVDYDDLERFHKLASIIKLCMKKTDVNTLDWGYDLWKWDYAHWQLTNYRKPDYELS